MDVDNVHPSKSLFLLFARFDEPSKDLVASTLAWMCRERGVAFDAYYAAFRGGGGLFSHHGSTVLGGRHGAMIARALAQFSTTVVTLGDVQIFGSLVQQAAAATMPADNRIVDLYAAATEALGIAFPTTAVAFQTQSPPAGLPHGTVQYAFPEAVYRQAVAVPVELGDDEIERLRGLGVRDVWTVASAESDTDRWASRGFDVRSADLLRDDDDYRSFTFRVAERWLERTRGIDMCEPVLACSWLPFAVRENRLQVSGESMTEATAALAPLVRTQAERVVYGRYGGGPLGVAVDDEELFNLFANDIAFQVIEPGRPALTVFSGDPGPRLPQPAADPFSLEPSDEQLRAWADKGRILVALVTHSGELSHDDAIVNTLDLSALTGVKVGIGMQAQRYEFDPDCVEPLHVPTDEGGVLGLCEPVLHSCGLGIIAESLTSPAKVVAMMEQARDRIGRVAGERFVPRGVYCYLDARPRRWQERPEELWQAIAAAGFEYVISSVEQGPSRVLYRDGDFVVLNLCGHSRYPFSPFMRVERVSQLLEMERTLAMAPGPAWMIGALDIPIHGYSQYIALGDAKNRARLGDLFTYVRDGGYPKRQSESEGQTFHGGESGRLVSVTPHTVARYARLIFARGHDEQAG